MVAIRRIVLLIVAMLGVWGPEIMAQPRPGYDPSTTHMFPAGGRRGTTTVVRLGTECAPPMAYFSVEGEGITAPRVLGEQLKSIGEPSPRRSPTEIPITYPREWASHISIAEDAPLGPVTWRIHCAQGGTPSRVFLIGDLPEWIERESNSNPERAEDITLPITVNGQISGERDVDYYRFSARAGEVICCEVLAQRLGSPLDPVAQFLDESGLPLPVDEAHPGNDSVLVLRAPRDGQYMLRMANVSFHGGPAYVYRIQMTRKPYLAFAFPAGGQAGTEQPCALFVLSGLGQPQIIPARIGLPAISADLWTYRDSAVHGSLPMGIDSFANIVESEPNETRSAAERISLPVTVNARFEAKDDEDCFRFAGHAGRRYSITCRAVPGDACLPVVELLDAAGNRLSLCRGVESTDGVCRVEWQAPADGDFCICARDLRRGVFGGLGFVYRLTISEALPDFALELPSDNVNIQQGNSSEFTVSLRRRGGFKEPVELSIDGLPPGISMSPAKIEGDKTEGKVKLTVGPDVAAQSVTLRVIGRSQIDGAPVSRVARASQLGAGCDVDQVQHTRSDAMHLTVTHKPLFRLQCSEAYQYAYRGTVYPYLMEIERLDGFNGPIVVQQGDRQNRDLDGIEMWDAVVPSGSTEFALPIYLPETMHINVQSQSQLYAQAYAVFQDKHGNQQSVLVLSEKRNLIRTLPTVVKLKSVDDEVRARPGTSVYCRLQLDRTTNFLGPMTLQLLGNDFAARGGPVTVAEGQTEITAEVRLGNRLPSQSLTWRGIGYLDPGTQVISEASVRIVAAVQESSGQEGVAP